MLFIQNEKILSFFSLSLYLWFWVQICILLWHSLWSKVVQSFKGFNCGLEQYWTIFHRKNTRSLIQNVKLDFCWCPETDVRMCGCAMFAPRNHASQCLYFGIDCVYGPIVRETVWRFSRLVVIYLSIYRWLWVQSFLLFWHSLWSNCRRNLCLTILRVLPSSGRL